MARFVTAVTYSEVYLAEMARAALEDAGITVYLADTEVVGNQWHLGTAVGGVKVQVAEGDAERAVEIIRDVDRKKEIDEEALAREALAATPEADVPLPPPVEIQAATTAEERADAANAGERDEYARRFFRATLFATLCFPLAAYALYLLLNATLGSGSLTAPGRRDVKKGLLLSALFGPFWYFLLAGFLAALLAAARGIGE